MEINLGLADPNDECKKLNTIFEDLEESNYDLEYQNLLK